MCYCAFWILQKALAFWILQKALQGLFKSYNATLKGVNNNYISKDVITRSEKALWHL